MDILVLTCVLLVACVLGVSGFPQGAPIRTESCVNLQPIHRERQTQQRIPNRQEKAPYRVLMSQQSYISCRDRVSCQRSPMQGDIMTGATCGAGDGHSSGTPDLAFGFCEVIIRGIPNQQIPGSAGRGTPFRGFIIQARTPSGGTRSWGRFVPMNARDSKAIQCTNGQALTHTVNTDKQEVRFNWIPEPGMREQVQFVSTIVQNVRTIYPLVYSDIARPNNFFIYTTTTTTTTPRPTTTTTTTTTTTPRPTTTTTTTSTATTTTPTTTTLMASSTQDGTTTPATFLPSSVPTVYSTTTRLYSSGSTTSAGLTVIIASLLIALL